MKTFPVPKMVEVDAYQAFFEKGGCLPPGMTDFQVSQGIHRKALLYQDGRTIAETQLADGEDPAVDNRQMAAGMMPFKLLELDKPMTYEEIDQAQVFYDNFLATPEGIGKAPFPRQMFETIVREYGGYWPVCVMAMQDGQVHYKGEPHVQIFSDVPGVSEAVGWLESTIGPYAWKNSIVATRGRMRRERLFNVFKAAHPSMPEALLWDLTAIMFHDFGRRGGDVSQITGIAHLINFLGTDTLDAAYAAQFHLNGGKPFGACSIVATAHRTMSAFPTVYEAMRATLEGYEDEFRSVVADTTGQYEKEMEILASFAERYRGKKGKVIGRPDSGDPMDCVLKGLQIFENGFGVTEADGLKQLINSGIIQGDGIDDTVLFEILDVVVDAGYSPLNVAFGMGEHNHKGNRSWNEWGYKTCLLGDGLGGHRDAMKFSRNEFKASLPCPVGLNLNGGPGPRVYPVTVEQLLAGDVGDWKVVYDGRPDPLPVTSWTFDETRKLAETSWRQLEPDAGDTICPTIRQMQRDRLAEIAESFETVGA